MKSKKKELETYKPAFKPYCYYNPKDRITITWDKYQWMLDSNSRSSYYPTIYELLEQLGEIKVREYTGNNLKTLLRALKDYQKLILDVSMNINLPKGE
jgi:hypothetical protein